MKFFIFAAVAAVYSMTVTFAEVPLGLDGATGNIYKVDLKARNVHFYQKPEQELLGASVAEVVKKTLSQRKK